MIAGEKKGGGGTTTDPSKLKESPGVAGIPARGRHVAALKTTKKKEVLLSEQSFYRKNLGRDSLRRTKGISLLSRVLE